MTGAHVIVVEDDAELRGVVVRGLREEGFRVGVATSGRELMALVNADPPDLLLVDVGLPDTDGRDLCQALRGTGLTTPVLFLTARDTLADRLAGFSAGGDDYLTKPFAFDELVARARALVRRGGADPGVSLHGLRLDPVAHQASCGDVELSLTPTEFRLLAALCAQADTAVPRRELVRAAWPHGAIVHANTLDAYIARIRRKLRPLADAPEIVTVYGVGYTIR